MQTFGNGGDLEFISFEYILIFGPCAGGPTDVSILSHKFSLVHDTCSEGKLDTGAKLYRQVTRLPSEWQICRHALIKRLKGGLASRDIICEKKDDVYI
mgnify:CR=1 FL=1